MYRSDYIMNKSNPNKAQNPMSEYLLKLQMIVSNAEFKNKEEAMKYETVESKMAGDMYVRAMTGTDKFESYEYSVSEIGSILAASGFSDEKIDKLINIPQMIPNAIKNKLLVKHREIFISTYKEPNRYYVWLSGKPYQGDIETASEKVITIPDDFYELYKDEGMIEKNQPIHDMPLKYQELFMNSEMYQRTLSENPDSRYLHYIGSNSIPIHVSRQAKDGDILRINTNKLSTYNPIFGHISVEPSIVHAFSNSYQKVRDYIYNTLRGDFSNIYPNYNSFIRFLTIYMAIGNTMNEFMKKSSSMIYMNNVTANNFFMLYGFPSVIMEGSSLTEFIKKFRLLLMDKGTNVVYRVKDLIGYEYTDIYTLVMVKQQVFDNGVPVYDQKTGRPKQNIVFRRLGTTDDNTSYFKFRESSTEYDIDSITSGDPRWWNTPEVESMINDMNYTLSNSKYIQLSTHLSLSDIWWQCVILLRGLLDQRLETQYTKLSVNFNLDGMSEISVFEAVLVLITVMTWHMTDFKGRSMTGDIYTYNGEYDGKQVCLDLLFNGLNDDGSPKDLKLGLPYKLASFNFNIREEYPLFYNSIKEMDYIEPDIFLQMLNKVLDRENINLGEVLMDDVRHIYKYLEDKLLNTRTIREFRQVTDIFSHLFLVDPVRNWYDNESFNIDTVLMDEYDMTLQEWSSLKTFFKVDAEPELYVKYGDISYPIRLYGVLNKDVLNLSINGVYPFRDSGFVSEFTNEMRKFVSQPLLQSYISPTIKNNYQNIIIDKVILDTSNTATGPKTFESLLFRCNPSLYRYITSMKNDGESLLLLMRSIVKSLENYANTSLNGLEYTVMGEKEYFTVLKEVISYFKSYMVEFTKDEFVLIFDGLFDNGGNSNMLKLHDEITSMSINMVPKESLTLYDVSYMEMNAKFGDKFQSFRDEALFRRQMKYKDILESDYDVWYDDGKRITRTPFNIQEDSFVTVNLIQSDDRSDTAYKIIINKKDVVIDNHYGNT